MDEEDEELLLLAAAVGSAISTLNAAAAAAAALLAAQPVALCSSRRVHTRWVKTRGQSWWETTVPHFQDNEFREYFRMCRATFTFVVEMVRSDVQR